MKNLEKIKKPRSIQTHSMYWSINQSIKLFVSSLSISVLLWIKSFESSKRNTLPCLFKQRHSTDRIVSSLHAHSICHDCTGMSFARLPKWSLSLQWWRSIQRHPSPPVQIAKDDFALIVTSPQGNPLVKLLSVLSSRWKPAVWWSRLENEKMLRLPPDRFEEGASERWVSTYHWRLSLLWFQVSLFTTYEDTSLRLRRVN